MTEIKNKEGQSLINFRRALANLEMSVALPVKEPRDMSGIIKDFEMAYELSWKVLKRKLREEGHQTLGAKDVYSKAYQLGYLKKEQPWLSMIQDRNLTAHVYDEESALRIVERIKKSYLSELQDLAAMLSN